MDGESSASSFAVVPLVGSGLSLEGGSDSPLSLVDSGPPLAHSGLSPAHSGLSPLAQSLAVSLG